MCMVATVGLLSLQLFRFVSECMNISSGYSYDYVSLITRDLFRSPKLSLISCRFRVNFKFAVLISWKVFMNPNFYQSGLRIFFPHSLGKWSGKFDILYACLCYRYFCKLWTARRGNEMVYVQAKWYGWRLLIIILGTLNPGTHKLQGASFVSLV
jgi:hypothetical protein